MHSSLHFVSVVSLALLAVGCATAPPPAPAVPDISPEIPVVRQGRYTLVELRADEAQQDLLKQVVELNMPGTFVVTVGDALRHVLLRSGYALCNGDLETQALYELPLPAAHLRLGPMLLRSALLTLAGPGWVLGVDDIARSVCFSRFGTSATEVQP